MKWFVNLKIMTKMIIGFLFIALLCAVMGVFGIVNLESLKASDTEMYENMVVPLENISDISEAFQRQRVAVRQAMLSEDANLFKAETDKISQYRKQIDDLIPQFEATILTEDMKKLFEEFKTAKEAYRPLLDKVLQLGQDGKKSEALTLMGDKGEAGIAAAAEMDAIDKIVAMKVDYASKKSDTNTAQANNTILISIIIVGVVIILAAIIGVAISRLVSKPIQATANCAKALAEGKLDEPLTVKSRDEAGQLASTIDKEVRQAFKNIEQARIISEKQAKYQSAEVEKLVVNLGRLSKGELYCDMVVAEADGDTEALRAIYSQIAENLTDAVSTIKGYIGEISEVLTQMSGGNLNVEITSEYKGDFIELKDSINGIVASLNNVLTEINSASDQVAAGTRQVSEGSQAISQGATEQASSIEELTASVTQIAAQTKQNAVNANKANELSITAKEDAIDGNNKMKNMQRAMAEINESSENINKIIKVIDDIAFQTNILALNAAVEAARAGMHGKGFAVVAEEVRTLAARSANAAKETTALIEGSIQKVEAGTKIADETAEALGNIVTGVENAVQLVGDIATASNEQATGISQVNKGIEQLSQVVQTNSATAEEAAAASEELSSQADLLKSMVAQFKLKTGAGESSARASAKDAPGARKSLPAHTGTAKIPLDDREFGKY
jgi:methyl-accepting chemotaxis protein